MSNLSGGLPPTINTQTLSGASVIDVAARIVELPASLTNSATPQKLSATVMGQLPNGSIKLQTDQGVVTILLKDRTKLPEGLKLDIEIPSGRSPRELTLRPAPQQPNINAGAITNTPTLAQQVVNAQQSSPQGTLNATSPALKIDRTTNLSATDIDDILTATKTDAGAPIKPTNLNAGSAIRLTQTPAESLPEALTNAADIESTLIQNLLNIIGESDNTPQAQKLLQTLAQLSIWSTENKPENETTFQNLKQQLQNLLTRNGTPNQTITTTLGSMPTPPSIDLGKTIDARVIAILPQIIDRGENQHTASQNAQPLIPHSITPLKSAPVFLAQAVIPTGTSTTNNNTNLNFQIVTNGNIIQNYNLSFPVANIDDGQLILLQPLSTAATLTPTTPQDILNWIKSSNWESLNDLVTTIQTSNPTLAAQITAQLPSIQNGAQNNPLAILFLTMLNGNHIEDWVGASALNILRPQARDTILKSLHNDQSILNKLDSIPLNNDWKLNLFPFWHDGQAHKAPLFFKSWDDKDTEDHDNKRRKKMRFLFDLRLDRMGKIQVDGFFQGTQQTPRLDMILRAEHALSPPMQQRMKNLYTISMERSNLHGELSFQFRPDQWVNTDDIFASV